MDSYLFEVDQENAKSRLDVFLSGQCHDLSRSYIQRLIEEGQVTVNDLPTKANYKLRVGDRVAVEVPPAEELQVVPEPIPLDIYYEDNDVIVVNKPRGMVVHPAEGNTSGTLVNALLYHCRDLSGINGVLRPGIVHRLDKDTSGLIMVAKNDLAHNSLAQQLKDRTVTRRYRALVHNNIREEVGTVNAPIGRDPRDRQRMAVVERNSKPAVTHYRVLERFGQYTLVECRLETGRTHQIRVHMAYIGHPVVGDPKYGPTKPHFDLDGQLLHAGVLGFKHPTTGQYLEFTAPLPDIFEQVLHKLKSSGVS
ncbi:pseudouridine synthase, RluA family [Desulfotomaculum nigrificans CO-1-SRB]|uniref:Pseudouridine synthase n=1 Tax=Desulfotomaculum nigrificans (strain DSM 14880 / VKM B-2319 / CO-1-SRB) TaxID=868595 RepID=F6B457_DESCC|nr:RluA family pseudouridine synthase [Desulfotomaculum nigrificans]AEF94112.1 pseudouridine synthase, RluA family [Desulfotomaculum nigrificans CO-1-SRB]